MLRLTPIGIGFFVLGLAVFALAAFQGVTVATHVFDDVPTGAFYHDDVETIQKLNITNGCDASPPLYCPNDDVSRGEMGTFLARTAELYRAAYFQTDETSLDYSSPSYLPMVGDSFTAPADCVLILSADVNWDDDGNGNYLVLRWYVDNNPIGEAFLDHGGGTGLTKSHGALAFSEVAEGDHFVQLRALRSGTGTLDIWTSAFYALCVPFDGAGNVIDA